MGYRGNQWMEDRQRGALPMERHGKLWKSLDSVIYGLCLNIDG